MRLRDILSNLEDYSSSNLIELKFKGIDYKISDCFENQTPGALIVQAFGSEDQYNEILARDVLNLRECFRSEILAFVQTEVGNLLKSEREIINFGEIYKNGESSKVLSKVTSYELLKEIKNKIDEKNLDAKNVCYFAHPGHVYRVMEIGRKNNLEGGCFIPSKVVWPDKDPQKWVRSSEAWKKRELMTRVHHWMLGHVPREL